MADRTLVLSWERPGRGREERALEAFSDVVGYYGRVQQEGGIEGLDVVLLAPNGDLGGMFLLRGSTAQLNALKDDAESNRLVADAQLCVDGIRLACRAIPPVPARPGDAMARQHKPERALVAALIRTAVTPADADRSALASLAARCRPPGSDRRQPVAVEWVRRWGANRVVVRSPHCGCAAGRCAWCN